MPASPRELLEKLSLSNAVMEEKKIRNGPARKKGFDGEISPNEKLTMTQSNKIRSEMPSEAPIKLCRVVINVFWEEKLQIFNPPSPVKHLICT